MTIKTDEEENKLQIGVRLNDIALVRSALNEGFDPNEAGVNGWTSLHECVSNGSSSITLALLRKGGDPNLQDAINKRTPLHLAALSGDQKLVQVLLDGGADISLRNVEGKTPEQLASSSCKQILERKRIELLMRGGNSSGNTFLGHSVQKMYTQKQGNQMDLNGSINHMESLDYSENIQPGPGEIQVSFEYLGRYSELKINVLEIRDLKLPPVHNYTTLYVKCYLKPDKSKETKRKTTELRIEMSDGSTSRAGSASSQSSQSSQSSTSSTSSIGSGKQITDKVKSVLKKRPHLHSKKNKDDVQCMLNTVALDTVCRASTVIDETLSYGSSNLSNINMAECQVHLSVCGRNRWSAKGIPIADVVIPLAVGLKKVEPEWFPLEYKIDLPVSLCRERRASQLNKSYELKEGSYYTGRSLAWDQGMTSDSSTSNVQPDTISSSVRKHHKHPSKTSRFLKGELKLFRGKKQQHNGRYNRSMDSIPDQEYLGKSSGESQDAVEYIGDEYRGSQSNITISSKTVVDQQISGHFPSGRTWNSSKNLYEARDSSKENQVQILNSRYANTFKDSSEQVVSGLKYSRAFGEPTRHTRFTEDEIAVEDVEDDFDVNEHQTNEIKPRHSPKVYRH